MPPACVLSVLSPSMRTPSVALRKPLPTSAVPPSPRSEMLPAPSVLKVLPPSQTPLRISPAPSASGPLTCPPIARPLSLSPCPKKRMFPPLASMRALSNRMAAAMPLAWPTSAAARPCASALNSTFSAPLVEAIVAPPSSTAQRMSMLPTEFTRSVAVPPPSLITWAPGWNTTASLICATLLDERVVSVTSVPWLSALPMTLAAMLPELPSATIERLRPASAVQLPLAPPALPPASICVPASTFRLPAVVRMLPPATPAALPRASSVPLTSRPAPLSTVAPMASSTISPPRSTSERARTVPLWLTTCCTSPEAPTSTTRPPSAVMEPVFITSALVVGSVACTLATDVFMSPPSSGTVNFVSPSPSKSSVTRAPDTRPAEPRATLIWPSLRTSAPISPTVPPSPTLMIAPGWTVTRAMLLASLMPPPNTSWPPLPTTVPSLAIWLSLMSSVEATSPPTFTWAPLPKRTPEGLTTNTCPLADSVPLMTDCSITPPLPTTRLSITLAAPICWLMSSVLPPASENAFQLTMAFIVLWLSLCMAAVPLGATPTLPNTTVPLWGKPVGRLSCAQAGTMPMQASDSTSGRTRQCRGRAFAERSWFLMLPSEGL
ncbi:hypothetical protein QFZ47_003059 [Variovorax paradoxus]|nr:hypothetical protein [Variovorax paradoxus]